MHKTLSATLLLSAGLVFGPVAIATPGASADVTPCAMRGADHWKSQGKYEDDRYHITRGELRSCHPKEKGSPGKDERQSKTQPPDDKRDKHVSVNVPSKKKDGDKDKKSRFCRKHWFC